ETATTPYRGNVVHNKMKRLTTYILLISILTSCGIRMELGELYKQPIENSSQVIYYFRLLGSFATSSDYTGYVILDSTIEFSVSKIKKNELRGGFVESIKDNEIKMLNLTWDENYDKENDSIGYFIDKFGDIEVKTSEYNSGWSLGNKYYFDKITDSNKTVTFIGLEKEYGHGQDLPDSVTFNKGGIFIHDNDGLIEYIHLGRLMTRKRKDDTIQYGTQSYQFYPRDSVKVSELSDYGYFKRIK
ncbi:hypothetical protein ACE01N_20590, partial [Saccharicrinis sp. FJH2]|uniref:hypothetical protein n=1 Tax=Saccharicrinis sp. FJH65 TaxID=3344659 RepID=UPI0035F303F3